MTTSAPFHTSTPTLDQTDVLIAVPDGEGEAGRAPDEHEKEEQTKWLKRKLGNTVPGRLFGSLLSTGKATMSSVECISPWGDNNPVVLPCIRVRDVAVMGIMAVTGGLAAGPAGAIAAGAGATGGAFIVAPLAGAVVGGMIRETAARVVIGKGLDKAFDGKNGKEEVAKALKTDDVLTLEVTLKHKLLNRTAQLAFFPFPSSPSPSFTLPTPEHDYSKGWFLPYLMASQRTPAVPRKERCAAIMSYGPFIEADYLFTHHLLSSTPTLIPFCSPSPTSSVPYTRMFLSFLGLSPYRSIWTSSRRPEEAKLIVHLANGIPGIIIPVLPGAPYQLWSSLPLSSLLKMEGKVWEREGKMHEEAMVALLESLIDWEHFTLPAGLSADAGAGEDLSREVKQAALARAVGLVFEGMRLLRGVQVVKERVDAERAGMVGLRFGNASLFEEKEEDGGGRGGRGGKSDRGGGRGAGGGDRGGLGGGGGDRVARGGGEGGRGRGGRGGSESGGSESGRGFGRGRGRGRGGRGA